MLQLSSQSAGASLLASFEDSGYFGWCPWNGMHRYGAGLWADEARGAAMDIQHMCAAPDDDHLVCLPESFGTLGVDTLSTSPQRKEALLMDCGVTGFRRKEQQDQL